MTLRPCIDCGEPCDGPRCPEHTAPDTKPDATTRGYDAAWKRLSRRARRLQPWCESCGATEDLQTDHTPEAWARKTAGKPIRLQDVRVLCGPCNRAAGAARGTSVTRGDDPSTAHGHSAGSRDYGYTPLGGIA
jgi:5-methylcytosine-specific restriction enzyme A